MTAPRIEPARLAPHALLTRYYGSEDERQRFVRELFDTTAVDYDRVERMLALGSGAWYRRQALQRAGLAAGMRVVDVGTGTGLLAREALSVIGAHGALTGVDPSAGMMAQAHLAGVELLNGCAEALPCADAAADFVSMGYALRHLSDLDRALAEFHRVLRPGGYLLAEFYNTLSLRYLIKRLKRPTAIAEDINDEAVYTRYDSLPQIRSYLPPQIRVETVHGIRVVTPFSQAHRWPLVGPALRIVERQAAVLPGVRRLGGFLLVVGRKES